MSVTLLTTRGTLRVVTCQLCAALVVALGVDRHDAVHRAAVDREHVDDEPLFDALRGDEPVNTETVRDDDEAIDRLADGGEPRPDDPLEPMLSA